MAKRRRHVLQDECGRVLARLMASSSNLRTQTALAKKSGVAQATIGRILRGEVDPQFGTMMYLAQALGKTLAAVAEGEAAAAMEAVMSREKQKAVPDMERLADALASESAELRRVVKALDQIGNQLRNAMSDRP